MPAPSGNGKSRSRRIAFGGVFAALAIALMLLGSFLPLTTFSAPLFASICIQFLLLELGAKTALLSYGAVTLISLFLSPDKEIALLFALVFGFYPVLKTAMEQVKPRLLCVALKLLFFNFTTVLTYVILLYILSSPALLYEFSKSAPWFWFGILLLGNAVFFTYDILLGRLKLVYFARIRPRLFR